MDKKSMGVFLSALRKTHGYTQQEVADKLNISNKTVSKWERDEGCPEIMMLPAIAELYGVTVDEILRGERILKQESEQVNEEKTEKRAKYIFDKAQSRLTNLSFISITLGVLASILAFITWELSYNYTIEAVCIILTLLISCASVIVQIASFNNIRINFNDDINIYNEQIVISIKKKAITYLCATIGLVVVTVFGIVPNFLTGIIPYGFIPISIFAGGAVAVIIYQIVCKKMGLNKIEETILSPEFFAYKKRHIKITSIIVAVVMVVCASFPFAAEIIDSIITSTGFSFSAAAEYNYDSINDAENDYNKLKDFYLKGKSLYIIEGDYSTEFYVYKIIANCVDAKFDSEGNVVSGDYEFFTDVATTISFGTSPDAEEFVYNECWTNDELNLYNIYKNVSFNDEDMSVKYTSPIDFRLSLDILLLFILIGSCISIFTSVISYAVYYKKRKNRQ